MENNQIDTLIEEANLSFQRQDWQSALDLLNRAGDIDPNNSEVLIGKGQCLINLGLAHQAIPVYERIVNLMPNVPDVHNNLGVVYLITNNLIKAEMSFKEALILDDDNVQAWKNLAQLYLQQGDKLSDGLQILSAVVQNNPEDTEALSQLALCYEIAGDYESAILLLNRVLQLEPDHQQARQILNDIQSKQVGEKDRIARPEHAKKLSGLKSLLEDRSATFTPVFPSPVRKQLTKTAAFYSPDEFSGKERLPSIVSFYGQKGYKVSHEPVFDERHFQEYDALIFYSPNLSGQLVNAVNLCVKTGRKFYVDMDIDFHNLPADHPAYTQYGAGNPNAIKVINIILNEAELITTASKTLAERLLPHSKQVEVALPAWNPDDVWWNRPSPIRDTVNIGWMGSKSDIPNLLFVKKPLQEFFLQNSSAIWFSVGCDEAYNMFSDLPEERRRYLPPPTGESIAYMMTNFDILLVPFLGNMFNQAKSDLPLLYASVRGIPWVASPLPSFLDWKEGGYIAENQNDWYKMLTELANDPMKRKSLGSAGKRKAQERKLLF